MVSVTVSQPGGHVPPYPLNDFSSHQGTIRASVPPYLDKPVISLQIWGCANQALCPLCDAKSARARVGELLREGATLTCDKTRRTCESLLDLGVALWTFVRMEGVEPTNNDAERQGRRAVLWRCRSFGTQSAEGSRFVEIS